MQRYLAQMVEAGTEVAILETTSHGLAQHRVTGCAFDIAVVTNITHEHLDFHGSYDAYREAKAMLFRMLGESESKPGLRRLRKTRVLNADDASYPYLLGIPAEQTLVYHRGERPLQPVPESAFTEIIARNIRQDAAGLHFDVELRPAVETAATQFWTLTSQLLGAYNVSNILAACGAAIALGVDPNAIARGVSGVAGIPGRMERIYRGQSFTAIVDFAHTPNALTNVLQTARALVAGEGGRLIVVFGSAGLRDRAKRGLMGEAAAQYADFTVITAEDPRTEELAAILDETADAMRRMGRVEDKRLHAHPRPATRHPPRRPTGATGRCCDRLREGSRAIHVLRRRGTSLARSGCLDLGAGHPARCGAANAALHPAHLDCLTPS